MSGTESTGGHPNGISRRAFVHREKAQAASPITYVTKDDAPILTVHGSADRVVPYDQAIRLDAALKKTGVRATSSRSPVPGTVTSAPSRMPG